jgi:GAF domain-containing protein
LNARDSSSLLSRAQACGREVHDIARSSPTPLSVADVFSLLAVRLKDIVTFDALAGYCPQGGILIPQFVSGENFRLFSSLRIPLGEGLSGWVAQNHKAIVNGNPSVEPGYLNDPTKYSSLRSALAVPIEDSGRIVAVLALYRAGQDAFAVDDLRALDVVVHGVAPTLEGLRPKSLSAAAGIVS